MENKEEVELLEDQAETTEEKPVEKIEIVEHQESKYDGLTPRTEMGEMTKEEKEELREKVVEEDTKEFEAKKEEVEGSIKRIEKVPPFMIIILIIVLGLVFFFWRMWPEIQASINSSPCNISTYPGSSSVQGRCGE